MTADVTVITGGSAGVGLAVADRLAREGRPVVILARGKERLEQAATMLRSHGAPVLALSVDMTDAARVDAAADQIEREFGAIGAWVNNAMATVVAPADQISAADYAQVTAATYLSQVYGTLAALRHMKPRQRGNIIQISSILAYRAVPLQAPYCAAKFAVSGFTDALRAEFLADDVPINLSVVYLPAVNTPQFNWSRNLSGRRHLAPEPLYDPRVCAQAIQSAIDHPRREIWVGQRTLAMLAGQSLAPNVADHIVSGFKEDQLGEAEPKREGNLYAPADGPAAIDGPADANIISARGEILTSRHYAAAKLAMGGTLALLALRGMASFLKIWGGK